MKTQIIKIDPVIAELEKVEKIVSVLRHGGLIIYPTETFYGLGADIFLLEAIQKVYRLKRRDLSKPLPVVISDLEMLQDVAMELPPVYRPLISAFWPGPLTIILKASSRVPEALLGPSGSIGIRLTGYKWLRALVRKASFPLTATSANISGEMEIADSKEAIRMFEGKVDLIVDGGRTEGFLPSTVLDLTGKKPRLIREGAISSFHLKEFLPTLTDEGMAK
jgi:L-threonylcarbamoyladenylate synthase